MPRSPGLPGPPLELTSLVGRDHELAEIRRILTESRLLTLIGIGGIGKTRTALRYIAHAQRVYRDGIWFVDLAAVQPSGVSDTVFAAIGVPTLNPDQIEQVLAERLDSKRTLLVLDNCEHVLAEATSAANYVLNVSSSARVLATSRQPLGVLGENLLTIGPLSIPEPGPAHLSPTELEQYESVRLFRDRARLVTPGFAVGYDNSATLAAVCRKLEGIPLAIELSALRLRSFSLAELLTGLDDDREFLTGGYRSAPNRQQSMSALAEWSYSLCTPAERLAWERAAVFEDGFDLDAAEVVCAGDGIDRAEVLDLIGGLVEKSVLLRGDYTDRARYRMLAPLRTFALDQLEQSGHDDHYRARHLSWTLQECIRLEALLHTQGATPAVAELRREHGNIAAALDHAQARDAESPDVMYLAAMLRFSASDVDAVDKARNRMDDVLSLAMPHGLERAKALWIDRMASVAEGSLTRSSARAAESRAAAAKHPSTRGYVEQCDALDAAVAGRVATAVRRLKDALQIHRDDQDVYGAQLCIRRLALIAWRTADVDALRQAVAALDVEPIAQPFDQWLDGLEGLMTEPADASGPLTAGATRLVALGDPTWVALWFDLGAANAVKHGNGRQAARLLGFAANQWASIGVDTATPTIDCVLHTDSVTNARARIGDEEFADAFDFGCSLAIEDAVRFIAREPTAEDRDADRDRLTQRENEVAKLVADGLRNRTIGEALFISERTVEDHVAHILTKLGFDSRTQIATWYAGREAAST